VATMEAVPLGISLEPNPARDVIRLRLALPESGDVRLRLYDAHGRQVAHRNLPGLSAGIRTVDWKLLAGEGRGLASGSYYVRMEAPAGRRTVRLTLLR